MKRFFSALAVVLVAIATVLTTSVNPAFAGDAAAGKAIFSANCAACHMGGGNVVAGPAKGLTAKALEANGMNDLDKIIYQVTNGKGAMPKFGAKLSDADIENVATYVLATSEKGW